MLTVEYSLLFRSRLLALCLVLNIISARCTFTCAAGWTYPNSRTYASCFV